MPAGNFTFWQQFVLDSIGPVAGALVGTLAIGLIALVVQSRRATAEQVADVRREGYGLRERLISEVLGVTTALYWATTHYKRAKDADASRERLEVLRIRMDETYGECKASAERYQRLLRLHMQAEPPGQTSPEALLHRVMDLLSVRYYRVIAGDGPDLSCRLLRDF